MTTYYYNGELCEEIGQKFSSHWQVKIRNQWLDAPVTAIKEGSPDGGGKLIEGAFRSSEGAEEDQDKLVNPNLANVTALKSLPGIGRVAANVIRQDLLQQGNYQDFDDFQTRMKQRSQEFPWEELRLRLVFEEQE